MGASGEQPPKRPTPQPAGGSAPREAHAPDHTLSNQATPDLHLPYKNRVRGATSGYDAFISYSHALDGVLAPALQTGLERFAKPWYRARALRVFRDNASLSASPGLWTSIEEALAASAWLVLMASPRAARSEWVNREVAWWLEHKSAQRLLVVLTEGQFAWAEDAAEGNGASAALPPALRGAFRESPRWVDLRWLHDVKQVERSNPRLQECVADIAAAVREVPKDELVGEHIRQHRRTMRLTQGGVTVLAVLLIAAVVAAIVAFHQRDSAIAQRDSALLSAEAIQQSQINQPLAAQLNVLAYRRQATDDLKSRLITTENAPLAKSLTGHTGVVSSVAFAPDGRTLASGSFDGTVRLWNLTDPAQPIPLGQPLTGYRGAISAIAYAPDGHTLAIGSASGPFFITCSNTRRAQALGQQPTRGHPGHEPEDGSSARQ